MIQIQRLTSKSSARLVVIIMIIAAVTLTCLRSTETLSLSRKIEAGNDHLELLWTSDRVLWFQDSIWNSDTVYAYTTTEKLLALDTKTGSIFWERDLPPRELGVRGLLVTSQSIFTVTSTDVYAYDPLDGGRVWTTNVGKGHVPIYFQKADPFLRVYYGEKIIDISPQSGNISSESSNADTYWIENNVEILRASSDINSSIDGIDRLTGKALWRNVRPIFRKEGWFPIQNIDNRIFVLTEDLRICAFDLMTGGYIWCLPDEFRSNLGINTDRHIGYALRSDFTLVEIDLDVGKILAETQFLPKELPVNMRNRYFEYTIAVTRDAVIASFGDSGQTFGLKIAP